LDAVLPAQLQYCTETLQRGAMEECVRSETGMNVVGRQE
jgi:hypothetical protein